MRGRRVKTGEVAPSGFNSGKQLQHLVVHVCLFIHVFESRAKLPHGDSQMWIIIYFLVLKCRVASS